MARNRNQIGIPLFERGVVWFARPFDDWEHWSVAFAKASRAIAREYVERRERGVGQRRDGAKAWLKRVAYDLLVPILEDDGAHHLRAWVEKHGRYGGRQAPDSINLMQVGLMAIFAHAPTAMSPQTREMLGKQLWHACRHYVPVEFVNGFIGQLESEGLVERASRGVIEDGFEMWIVDHRRVDVGDLDRGIYPAVIQDAIEEARLREAEADGWDT